MTPLSLSLYVGLYLYLTHCRSIRVPSKTNA